MGAIKTETGIALERTEWIFRFRKGKKGKKEGRGRERRREGEVGQKLS
ncbi:hypothetical protein IMZ48_44215 [Candidatus Bathyarchaeota archaeon]|nr:hypothetical protein [Candidatus Bathyarchaeota archaeon]